MTRLVIIVSDKQCNSLITMLCLLHTYQHIQIPRMITVIAMAATIVPDILLVSILLVSIKYSGKLEAVGTFTSPNIPL